MNKRMIFGALFSAVLSLSPAVNIFAACANMEYSKSLGVGSAATEGLYAKQVKATADGGYLTFECTSNDTRCSVFKFSEQGEFEYEFYETEDNSDAQINETENDYRIFDWSTYHVYVFDKTKGTKIEDIDLSNVPTLSQVDFDAEGDLFGIDEDGFLRKYNTSGQLAGLISAVTDENNPDVFCNMLVGDGFVYATTKSSTGESAQRNFVRVGANDLKTIGVIASFTEKGSTHIDSIGDSGNVIVMDYVYSAGYYNYYSYSQNGKLLAMMGHKTIGAIHNGISGSEDENGYKLAKLNEKLEPEYDYEYIMKDGEEPVDLVYLADGSLVIVGGTTANSSNYVSYGYSDYVDGVENSFHVRLAASKGDKDDGGATDTDSTDDTGGNGDDAPIDNTKNPNTFDEMRFYTVAGAIVLAGAAIVLRKMLSRR